MEEINKRLEEISEELQKEEITDEQVEALDNEVKSLEEQKRALIQNAEKRKETLKNVVKVKEVREEIPEESEEKRTMDNNIKAEYRTAFFKKLMRKELTEEETRALSTSTTAVIPTETSDNIFKKMTALVPLLNEIELFHVKGNLKFAVETTRAAAGYHDENSTGINEDTTAVLTEVSLGGYEFTKLIRVSDAMLNQSVDAFEAWITDMLSESIATLIENEIINGSGSTAVKGIDKITYVDETNAVAYSSSTGLTAKEVREGIGYLPAVYDAGAKFLMNKKTLFNQFMGLQDNAKCDIVRVEGNKYYVYGYPVILSDKVNNNVAYLGNFKKYVGNLSEDITVKHDFDIERNSNRYLGVATFDGKPAAEDAFVKFATSL